MADSSNFKKMADQAVQLNLSYYRSLFDVTKNYLEAVQTLITSGLKSSGTVLPEKAADAPAAPVKPVLLAGSRGKTTESAFTIVNHFDRSVNADVHLSESLKAAGVFTKPEGKQLAPGETAVFHVVAKITGAMDSDKDVHGTLSVPELASREIPVVVRRIASETVKKAKPAARKPTARKKKKATKTTKRAKR